MRPGGALVEGIIQPSWNESSVTYRIIGDTVSVTAVFDALVANCSVGNSSAGIASFSPSPTTWPLPEQIIQYYRASSFALSLDGYNNTAALPSNMPASNSSAPNTLTDTPLPSGLNMTFLQCVNLTIGASVPLVEPQSHKLSSAAIGGIVSGSIIGIIVLLFAYAWCASMTWWKRLKPSNWKIRRRSNDEEVPTLQVDAGEAEKETFTNGELNTNDDASR